MGKFSEFIVQLKHGWGKAREDGQDIQKRIKECYSEKKWDAVIELCSMLNWQEEVFDEDLTFILCESVFQSDFHDDVVVEIVEAFADYYPNKRFYALCGRALMYTAPGSASHQSTIELFIKSINWFLLAEQPSNISDAKKKIEETYLKWARSYQYPIGDSPEKSIQIYNQAINSDYVDSDFKKECKDSIFEVRISELDNQISQAENLKSWKNRWDIVESYKVVLDRLDNLDCQSKYSDSAVKTRKKDISTKISNLSKASTRVDVKLAQEFDGSNFPSTSRYCNMIRKEYPTLSDVLCANFKDLQKIPGMGATYEKQLKDFIAEKKDELNEIISNT